MVNAAAKARAAAEERAREVLEAEREITRIREEGGEPPDDLLDQLCVELGR